MLIKGAECPKLTIELCKKTAGGQIKRDLHVGWPNFHNYDNVAPLHGSKVTTDPDDIQYPH